MATKYTSPELVRLDDRGYRAHRSMHARLHRQASGGPTGPAPLRGELGKVLERGARSMLGERRCLSDRRVLSFVQSDPGRISERRYREIDAVVFSEEARVPIGFFEIKSSVSPRRALRKATAQLRILRRIVNCTEWGANVRLGAVLIVPEGADLPVAADTGEYGLAEDLDDLASLEWNHSSPVVLFIGRDGIWSRALERGWVGDESLLSRVRDLEAGIEPEPKSYSAGDGGGTSSLALALQVALERDDVD